MNISALSVYVPLVICVACGHGLTLTRLSQSTVPPAGQRVVLRVLRDDGEPVRQLTGADFEVVNDETDRPFGSEGGGAAEVGAPTGYEFYTILVLDMSDSIFNNGAVDDVIRGAETFIQRMVAEQPEETRQSVAIYAFGSTEESELWLNFTPDSSALLYRLSRLREHGRRGGTNLYGAYQIAMRLLQRAPIRSGLVTRSLILLTDGTDEAGDIERRRREALRIRNDACGHDYSNLDVYTIGIHGDYDEGAIRELASTPQNFFPVEASAGLTEAFGRISDRVRAIANSNYALGVCSPVETGNPTITINADVDGMRGSIRISYNTRSSGWTGNVSHCVPRDVMRSVVEQMTSQSPSTGVSPEPEARLTGTRSDSDRWAQFFLTVLHPMIGWTYRWGWPGFAGGLLLGGTLQTTLVGSIVGGLHMDTMAGLGMGILLILGTNLLTAGIVWQLDQ